MIIAWVYNKQAIFNRAWGPFTLQFVSAKRTSFLYDYVIYEGYVLTLFFKKT
jgi:hypothetical protein